jgi:hypothetical protein
VIEETVESWKYFKAKSVEVETGSRNLAVFEVSSAVLERTVET